ncbi:hypothetical protein D3C81_2173470 [compost metagenome]
MLCRIAQRLDFCMGAGVVQTDRPIAPTADDDPSPHHHSAYRHFTSLRSRLRLLQRCTHPVRIVFKRGNG